MTDLIGGAVVMRGLAVVALFGFLGLGVCQKQGSTQSTGKAKAELAKAETTRKTGDSKAAVDHYRRVEQWMLVEQYMKDKEYYILTISRWIHKPENETKSLADGAAALGLEEPKSNDAYQAAMEVMQANPTDDLGFLAIEFCLQLSPKEGAEKDCSERALAFLDRDYVSDPRLKHVLLTLARVDGDRGVALLDKVIQGSTRRDVRAEAAYWLVEEKQIEVDNPRRPVAERAAERAKITRLAHLVEQQYGDVPLWTGVAAGELIKPILFSLEHLSAGSVMPDMTVQRVDGGEDHLRNYRGKVVLLDYWATWCIPCVESLREHVRPLKQELQGQPFEVITVSIDDSPAMVQDFTKKIMPLPFVNWHIGMESPYYTSWGFSGVPNYILLDKNGVIQAKTREAEALVETARKLARN